MWWSFIIFFQCVISGPQEVRYGNHQTYEEALSHAEEIIEFEGNDETCPIVDVTFDKYDPEKEIR